MGTLRDPDLFIEGGEWGLCALLLHLPPASGRFPLQAEMIQWTGAEARGPVQGQLPIYAKGLLTYLAAPGSACCQAQSRPGLQSEERQQAQQRPEPRSTLHGLQALPSPSLPSDR